LNVIWLELLKQGEKKEREPMVLWLGQKHPPEEKYYRKEDRRKEKGLLFRELSSL